MTASFFCFKEKFLPWLTDLDDTSAGMIYSKFKRVVYIIKNLLYGTQDRLRAPVYKISIIY